MKLKHEFTIRQIAGEYVMIPMGKSALAFSGMITTNEVGAYICQQLSEEIGEAALLEKICREFEVEEAVAAADLEQFLQLLRQAELLQA